MTPGDAARVLGACALYDNRTVGTADAAAWFKAIGDLDVADAIEAVARHYAESTERIMPAHIRRIVKQIREERRRLAEKSAPRALPGRYEEDLSRSIRIEAGMAKLAPVLERIRSRIAGQAEADEAELSQSERIRRRAIDRKHGRLSVNQTEGD